MDKNNTDKNNAPIEAYDGKDAYYEGTDKDYEDFLKRLDSNAVSADTADVEESDSDSAGETINIKGVIDMVRKKAGEGWNTAKKIGGGVKEHINDYIAAASEKIEAASNASTDEDEPDNTAETAEAKEEGAPSPLSVSISNTARAAKSHIKSASEATREKLSGISGRFNEASAIGNDIQKISSDIENAISKLDTVSSKLGDIEVKQIENRNSYDRNVNDMRVSMSCLINDIAEMGQNTGSIAKLSDAVFDLKNTQANTKKAIADVEERVIALRKKVTAGVTLISVLAVIMIALEIINLLSY